MAGNTTMAFAEDGTLVGPRQFEKGNSGSYDSSTTRNIVLAGMSMLTNIAPPINNIPDIWGEGALFAFSGMDGETNVSSGFAAAFARDRYGLLFHTPQRRLLKIELRAEGTTRIATGDVLAVDTPQGDLVVAFSHWHTLIGVTPHDTRLQLRFEGGPIASWKDPFWVSEDEKNHDVLALVEKGGRFALSYGETVAQAQHRAKAGLELEVADEVSKRLAIYHEIPSLKSAELDRLLKKCVSVMKVNTLSKEGAFHQSWSTPDRVPHKHMWLWDSVFHSFAMRRLLPRLSWDLLKSVLDTQTADGMIPIQMTVSGSGRWPDVIQPPILAWGVWENYQALKDKSCLKYALPRLERYLEWECANRDRNGNSLLEWSIVYRGGEAGMDNSPRFDRAVPFDAVDFSVYVALEMQYTAWIARELGEVDKGHYWERRSRLISEKVHRDLWHQGDGFYYDREIEGQATGVKAVSGFYPLLLDDIPQERVDRLVQALKDPTQFNTAFPVPTVAVSDPTWSTDMWRGPTWVNTNYLVIRGLAKQGRPEEANWLARKSIELVLKYYQRYGVLFEFYDAKDEVPPVACDRRGPPKEPYDIRVKVDSIRDYHWTAAVTTCLLFGLDETRNQDV